MQINIQHDWTVSGPGGYYGLLQYQSGPGLFDAHTGVALGPAHFDLPLPIFAVASSAGVLLLLAVVFVYAQRTTRHNAA